MERRDEPPPVTNYERQDVGTGGKFRKPPARKPSASPYARPPTAKPAGERREEGGGGWFSKIVDPAYRLISSGSTRILPSFFSRSPSSIAVLSSDSIDHDSDEDLSDDDEEKGNLNLTFGSSGEAGPSRGGDGERCEANYEQVQNDRGTCSDGNRLSEIEQLLKGKALSRDEISRLTEILHIKATGLSSVELGRENSIMTDEGTTMSTLVAHETPKRSVKEKLEGPDKATWATSTSLPLSTTRDAVGASPVDIARAYMGCRTSEVGMSSRSLMSKDERDSADECVTKPVIPLPSPKPICWPGATVQHQRGYMTPQNERGKLGLHNFPRTPYSRTIFSKSKSKLDQLQGDGNIGLNTSSTPFRQFNTPLSEKVTSRAYGSAGPIHRIRHKVDESPRGSVGLNSSRYDYSNEEKSRVYAGFSPASKNLESWVTSSTSKFHSVEIKPRGYEVGHITVPSQSSQIARKILDHIDRKKPTLAEKSAEVKLAIESKRPLSSEVTKSLIKENNSLPTVETVASQKNVIVDHQTFSAQRNHYAANFSLKTQREESSHEANNEGNQNFSSSNLLLGKADGTAGPSFDFSKNGNSQIKHINEKNFMGFDKSGQKEENEVQPLHSYMNGQDLLNKVPNSGSAKLNLLKPHSNASSNKPVLPFISINKPSLATASQNYGFTFPVSSTSGVLSELPTPSIMPSLISAGGQNHTKSAEIPTYTFGSKRSDPALVFSFPSTSSMPANTDASEIKFTFGSDKNSRVSFSCC